MNLHRAVSTVTGVIILAALALIAVGLIWWQGELTKIEEETNSLYARMDSRGALE